MEQPQSIVIRRKPPGPPPGRPPILSDNEDISDDEEGNVMLNQISCYLFDCRRFINTKGWPIKW